MGCSSLRLPPFGEGIADLCRDGALKALRLVGEVDFAAQLGSDASSISWDPKPRREGGCTGGPPLSRQVICRRGPLVALKKTPGDIHASGLGRQRSIFRSVGAKLV